MTGQLANIYARRERVPLKREGYERVVFDSIMIDLSKFITLEKVCGLSPLTSHLLIGCCHLELLPCKGSDGRKHEKYQFPIG